MEWQPIETAPEGILVVVGWLEDDLEHPERYDFDQKEDGVWYVHEENVQYADACAPAGSRMPKQTAPYEYWMPLPPMAKRTIETKAPTIESIVSAH